MAAVAEVADFAAATIAALTAASVAESAGAVAEPVIAAAVADLDAEVVTEAVGALRRWSMVASTAAVKARPTKARKMIFPVGRRVMSGSLKPTSVPTLLHGGSNFFGLGSGRVFLPLFRFSRFGRQHFLRHAPFDARDLVGRDEGRVLGLRFIIEPDGDEGLRAKDPDGDNFSDLSDFQRL